LSPQEERLNEKDAINIMLIILKVANQGADYDNGEKKMMTTTNNAMYAVLFKHPTLKEFWNTLIEKGLLSYDQNTGRLKTTAQGRTFLKAYEAIDYDVIKTRTKTSSPSRRKKQLQHF
jgi:predicted transcriptional regulator